MTTCPDIGRLRAALDGEATPEALPEATPEAVPEAPADALHAETCPLCRQTRDELQRDATLAAATIGTLAPLEIPDLAAVEAALDAVRGGRSATDPDPVHCPRPTALSRL